MSGPRASARQIAGAVVIDDELRHLGSPLAEQRALAAGTAVALLDDRAVLAVTGEDRLSWLDSISSQALAHLDAGIPTETLILDPKGHVEHAASVLDDGETTWLIVDRIDAASLLSWLTRMRFRMRVTLRDAGDDYAVVGGTRSGLAAVSSADGNGVPLVWDDPWPRVAPGGWGYASDDGHAGAGWDWAEVIVTSAERERIIDAAVAGRITVVGSMAVDALRIAAWRPRRIDIDDRLLPHEVDWMRTAVHLNKGCYRGQETVAKVHNLGHPPRRMVALHLDGSESVLPGRGAAVLSGTDVVGTVLASALHHEDGPIALALVRRSTPADQQLLVATDDGEVTAIPTTIVPADAGAVAGVARLPRLGRRTAATDR